MTVLDPDIATEDALRLLSRPDPDDGPVGPRGWTRRRFLQAIGAGVFGGATVGTIAGEFFGGDVPEAWAGTPIGPNDGITVVVTLYGGVDGLNVVVPHGDGNYYARRSNIAIPQSQVLRIDDQHGFAPQLTYLKTLYDAGQVAVVCGVGYANPDLSHFTSMAIWMNGSFGGGPSTAGSDDGSTGNRRPPPSSPRRSSTPPCRCTCRATCVEAQGSRRTVACSGSTTPRATSGCTQGFGRCRQRAGAR
ncbi:MAG: hypothetical protein R2713_07605 [Ilumatobacteraceae bacterium]